MNLAAAAFKNKAFTHYVEVLILVLAAVSYFTLGKLEDPDFTVKRAAISTAYPGASAASNSPKRHAFRWGSRGRYWARPG